MITGIRRSGFSREHLKVNVISNECEKSPQSMEISPFGLNEGDVSG